MKNEPATGRIARDSITARVGWAHAITRETGLTLPQSAVLTNLAFRGGTSYPSVTTLCGDIGAARSTVFAALLQLESLGLVRRERRGAGGVQDVTVYHLQFGGTWTSAAVARKTVESRHPVPVAERMRSVESQHPALVAERKRSAESQHPALVAERKRTADASDRLMELVSRCKASGVWRAGMRPDEMVEALVGR